jgi:iron complex transport system ATP-binding protein
MPCGCDGRLIAGPSLVLLDEPATGLDVAAREQLLDTIKVLARSNAQRASVLVTHHLEEIPETTTHALLLAHGSIVAAGRIEDVLTSQNVTSAFDYPVAIERHGSRWSARTAPGFTTVGCA